MIIVNIIITIIILIINSGGCDIMQIVCVLCEILL